MSGAYWAERHHKPKQQLVNHQFMIWVSNELDGSMLTDSYTIYTAALNAAVQLTSEWSLVLCQYDEEQYIRLRLSAYLDQVKNDQ